MTTNALIRRIHPIEISIVVNTEEKNKILKYITTFKIVSVIHSFL